MGGGAAAGEAGQCEIKPATEKMNRAHFADVSRSKRGHHLRRGDESRPEALDCSGVIRSMDVVLLIPDRILYLRRHGVDLHVNLQIAQRLHDPAVEIGNSHRLEAELSTLAIGGDDP